MKVISSATPTPYSNIQVMDQAAVQRRFIQLYTITLLICFAPSKALAQFAGVFFLAGMLFYVQSRPSSQWGRVLLFGVSYAALGVFYSIINPAFLPFNFFFFFITFSGVLLIVLCDFRDLVSPEVLRRVTQITLAILVFQAIYGLLQGVVSGIENRSFDLAAGDRVRGTIDPSFAHAPTASNPIYAILTSSLLLFCLGVTPIKQLASRWYLIGLILLAWLAASVTHTILLFGLAVFATIALYLVIPTKGEVLSRILKIGRLLVVGGIGFTILLAIVFPKNFAYIPVTLERMLRLERFSYSLKVEATYATVFLLPADAPLQPLVGLGLGQYNSRAGLILSGEYLGAGLPFVPPAATPELEHYILPLWKEFFDYPGRGSSIFPYYSWLSWYGETGVVGSILLLIAIGSSVVGLHRREHPEIPYLAPMLVILLLYLVFLGIQDNYWEYTQAITPACILFRLGSNALRYQPQSTTLSTGEE